MEISEFARVQSTTGRACTGHGSGEGSCCCTSWGEGCDTSPQSDCYGGGYGGGYFGSGTGTGTGTGTGYGTGAGSGQW